MAVHIHTWIIVSIQFSARHVDVTSLEFCVLLSVKLSQLNKLILAFLCHTKDLKQKSLHFFIHSTLYSG